MRKRNISNGQDRNGSSRRPGRVIIFLENRRGIIKEKRVKTRSREIRGGYWPNDSPVRGCPNKPGRF